MTKQLMRVWVKEEISVIQVSYEQTLHTGHFLPNGTIYDFQGKLLVLQDALLAWMENQEKSVLVNKFEIEYEDHS